MSDKPTQYWWNSTSVTYACDDRTPSSQHWTDFDLVSAGTRMKMASGPYCNVTSTLRGSSTATITGGVSGNGSTWGCSVDGETWLWYSGKGNGESWEVVVLCAWDYMNSEDDIQTWLASDPSGKTSIAFGSFLGLPSDKKEEGKTSTMSLGRETVSQPAPFDLASATSTSSTSSSSSSSSSKGDETATTTDQSGTTTETGGTGTGTGTKTGEAKPDETGTSTSAGTTASLSSSKADSTSIATTIADSTSSSSSSGDSSDSTPNSSISVYIMVGVATFLIVGAILAFVLCLHKKGKKKRRGGSDGSSESEGLLSSDEDSDASDDGGHSKKRKHH
ncbi:hypothetical protein JCM16303_003662 [Sporobolomyces ruberrimus]